MRRGRSARREAADEAVEHAAMPKDWHDLAADEQAALKRLNRAVDPGLDQQLAARLVALGLAVPRGNGLGISRAGRAMVIDVLLQAVREQDERR